jgi:hypothetical protein
LGERSSRALIAANGDGATSLKFTLPKNNAALAGCPVSAISSTGGKALAAVIGSGTNVITVTNVDGTYSGADGKTIIISGSYQAAQRQPRHATASKDTAPTVEEFIGGQPALA